MAQAAKWPTISMTAMISLARSRVYVSRKYSASSLITGVQSMDWNAAVSDQTSSIMG